MSDKVKGITIEIGGDTKGLDKAIKSVNGEIRGTTNELKQVERLLKLDPTNTELLAQKQTILAKNVEMVENKLQALKRAKDKADKEMSDGTEINQEQYRRLQREIVQAEQDLKRLSNTADDAGKKIEDVSDKSDGFTVLKGTVADLVSNGIQDLINKTTELVEVTREYREDMNKLNTAFTTAGFSQEDANEVYSGFYKILGESDRTVEAVNHLAKLTDNQEDLVKWTNIAAGVCAEFTDSLPIEGLTEAANETAKVAKVTGPLADALNWIGISEDKFNEKLEKCNSERERAALITNTLSDAYSNSAEKYKTMNADIMANREATQKLTDAQAQLGAVLEPVLTSGKNLMANFTTIALNSLGLVKSETDLLIESVQKSTNEQKVAREAIYDNMVSQLAQVESARSLYDELLTLVDASGRVKDADKERASFIIGELNNALGLEIKMNGDVVSSLDKVGKKIDEVIQKKQAQILLQGQEELAAEAYKKEAEARKQQETALTALIEKEREYEEWKKTSDTSYSITGGTGAHAKYLTDIQELTKSYEDLTDTVEQYSLDTQRYEEATAAALEGNTQKVIDILNNESQVFVDAKELAGKTAEEKKEILGQQFADAVVKAETAAENYRRVSNEKNKIALDDAIKHAEEMKKQYEIVGGNIVDGTVVGIEGKKINLKNNLEALMSMVPDWAKKVLGIHSPSHVMRDEVGVMITEGVVVGIKKAKTSLEDAIKEQKQTIVDGFKEAAQEAADSIEEIEKAQESLTKKLSSEGNNTFTQYGIGDKVYTKLADVGADNNQLQQYSDLLDELLGKRGDLPDDIISYLSEMNVADGINYVTALLQASDAEYEKYILDLKKKQELSDKISKQLTADQLAETAAEIQKQFSEVSNDFFKIGEESAKQYGEGFMKQLDDVYNAVRAELLKGLAGSALTNGIVANMAGNTTNTTNNSYNNSRNTNVTINTPNPVATPYQQRVTLENLFNNLAMQGVL